MVSLINIYTQCNTICKPFLVLAIYNFDTSVVNLEALQQIYEVVSKIIMLSLYRNLKIFFTNREQQMRN
jgi:hypothetical protein